MTNWGHMSVTLSRLVTREEVLDMSRAVWDSYAEGERPFFPETMANHGIGGRPPRPFGGRDRCLKTRRVYVRDGVELAAELTVTAAFHELRSYSGIRELTSLAVVVGLHRRLTALDPGCFLTVGGGSDPWLSHTVDDYSVHEMISQIQEFEAREVVEAGRRAVVDLEYERDLAFRLLSAHQTARMDPWVEEFRAEWEFMTPPDQRPPSRDELSMLREKLQAHSRGDGTGPA